MFNKIKSCSTHVFRYIKYFLLHLKHIRQRRLIAKSQYFDKVWYVSTYQDLNKKGIDPVGHYLVYGWKEGREPSSIFKTWIYLKKYPDVKDANINPLLHYEQYGKKEGRNISYGINNYSTTFFTLLNIIMQIKSNNFNGRIILLVSHNLSLTGAPRALLNMAIELKKSGDIPIIAAFTGGAMEEEIQELGILLMYINPMDINKEFKGEKLVSFFNIFDYIVFNTIVTLELAEKIVFTNPTKISWIHEAEFEFEKASKRLNLNNAFKAVDYVYSVGQYSKKYTDKYLTERESDSLLYCIEDKTINILDTDNVIRTDDMKIKLSKDGKFIFAMIGALSERKGHTVLLEAINYLPQEVLEYIEFWIIGPVGEENVEELVINAQSNYYKYLGPIQYEKLLNLMDSIDVVLCPSLDDPMPMVATEAMMSKKAVLVTNNTGTAALIDDGINGYVVESGNPRALADKICEIYCRRNDLSQIGVQARLIYEQNFTLEHFSEQVRKVFDENRKISHSHVFIPRNNKIRLFDIEVNNDIITLVVAAGILNKIYVKYCDTIIYSDDFDFSTSQKCFDEYLNESNERLHVFRLHKKGNGDRIAFLDEEDDQMVIEVANYINLYRLSEQGTCVTTSGNILKLSDKFNFAMEILLNPKVTFIEKLVFLHTMLPRKCKYNLYFETLNNHNDNAYELFLMDLKKNGNNNAYFVTSKVVYENETDNYIKEHMIILNTIKHKKYALKAKKMVVSWWCFPIVGNKKMALYYPFLNYNYLTVLHGISYDKNSYYLNVYNFGKGIPTYCCSKYEKEYLEENNGYVDVKVLGYPRMDKWFGADLNENMIFLFPTWRRNITEEYITRIVGICQRISRKFPEMQVIYAAHPSIPEKEYKLIQKMLEGINGNIVAISSLEGAKFNEYFAVAKYLITDYSSVAYDHAYKENGISIYHLPTSLENEHYKLRNIFYEGHCGLIAKSLDDIEDIIREKYNWDDLERRKQNFFCYLDNHNTERVFVDIFEEKTKKQDI